MPPIFLGYPTKKARPTKLAVDTPVGQLEPAEPSVFKIYAVPDYTHPILPMISSRLGYLVNVLASPRYTQLPFSSEGDFVSPPNNPLLFRLQNLAFVVKATKDVHVLQSWRYNRYVDLDDPLPARYKVPVSVKSGDVGMFESDDEGWSSPLELDY